MARIDKLQRQIEAAERELSACVDVEARSPVAREIVRAVADDALARLRRVRKKLGALECCGGARP